MSKRKNEKQGSPDKAVKSIKSKKIALEETNEREFVGEVKTLLRNKATLLSGLNKLRDALKSKEPISFAVFKEFIRENSECPEVYKVLEKGRQQQTPLELQIALEILENLLLFTAEDPSSFGQVGMYHVRRILHNHVKLIYSCLNPNCHVNMIKGALRLLVAMVTQGVSAAREVVTVFDFTLKALGSMVNKRDLKASEDIRTCFIHFVMSFLMYGDDATIRHVLDIKGFVSSIFKLLPSDPPGVVNLVLTVLHQKVVQNNSIPKKTKVQFFSSFVLTKLASLYDYEKNENTEEEEEEQDERQTTKEKAHKVLQDVCCTFKFGICFANKLGMFAGRSNNPVLLRFLQSLPKHGQNLHLQQLITQILTCCPDLVQPYLSSQSTTYEPRLSLPWLTNMNFITRLYSALPSPSDIVEKSTIRLTEESVQPVLNTVLPSVLTRANLNQGIQHPSLLVKNTTLSLLVLTLNRAHNLLEYCKKETPSTPAQQSSLSLSFVEVFREALLRGLPDIKTIISLRQNLVASEMSKDKREGREKGEDVRMEDDSVTSRNKASPSLLLARVLQTLHLYQKIQPNIFSTTAFDLGKLLPGQQEFMVDRIFSPIVQYYTLEILSDLPRGMFKWYQQKSKNGPSYLFSVLKMFIQASSNKIRTKAKNLIIKFLQDTGIITQHLAEVDTWLKHLNKPSFERYREALLVFLDTVCHTVAMEPYTYTDVVLEMTSEAKARQANGEKFSLLLHVDDNLLRGNLESRVAFSPLIVKAIMEHTQMVAAMHDKYTNEQLCCIAQYINVVILDVLRNTINPLPLILTVKRFYDNEVIFVDCASLKTTHQSLLSYIDTWLRDSTSIETVEDNDEDETSFGLEAFLKSQASTPSQESLVSFLSDLNEPQLQLAVGPCVQLCLSKFAGDFRPLLDLLIVKPYCITGKANEDIFPLLKKLPFANLLWQVFGPLLNTLNFNGRSLETEDQDARNISKDNEKGVPVFLLIQHPGVQGYLVDSLQKEDISTFPRLCNNLLQYLTSFISQVAKYSEKKQKDFQGNRSRCQGEKSRENEPNILKSVVSLAFQLINAMADTLETLGNMSEKSLNKNLRQPSSMKADFNERETHSSQNKNGDDKATELEGFSQQTQEHFLKTLLQNPVLLNCFLSKFDSEESTATADVWLGLSFCIGNLLYRVLDRIERGSQGHLLKPYTRKICEKAVDVVTKATANEDFSPDGCALQALHLLQVFSPFCDQASLSEPIAKLLELPYEALVKKSQNQVEPTIYLQTLLALLGSEANHLIHSTNQESDTDDVMVAVDVTYPCNVTLGSNEHSFTDNVIKGPGQLTSLANQGSSLVDTNSMFSHMIDLSNQKAALLSPADFVKVTKLLQEVPSIQLDHVVLKLLRSSPRYILEIDPSLLDHCLDNVTEERVAIATALISSSASLRVHFEQRCASGDEVGGVRVLDLRDHHWGLLPLVHWYLTFAQSIGALSSENKVVSYLSENYWPHLWNWIREPKKSISRVQNLICAVLRFLLIMKSHDTKDTRKLFSKLLDLIPSQSWDVYQMNIIRMMLDLLVKKCSSENKQRVLVGSAVSVCMVNISLMPKLNPDDKSLLTHAVSMLLDIVSTHMDYLLHGEDSLVEVETWSTFVKNCLKYRFECAMTLQCMTACVKPLYNSTKHKTLTREFPLTTMYQLILSHSKFLEIMLENNEGNSVKLKEPLVDLVVAIAELCPECCESSHLPVFFGSYTATLSKTDQSILYLLQLYERAQVPLSSFRPYLWGKAALEHHKIKKIQGPSLWQQPSTNEVLELLDVTTLNHSALDFPVERKLRPRVQSDLAAKNNLSCLYDPSFILPLFGHLLAQSSVVDCRKFVERGGLGYTVSALSSRDEHMRKAASHVLSRCLTHMDAASFREKKQVYLLLESLKNGITDVSARVSSVITRFVSRAAYIMLHPESQMYVLVNSFLLQRAVMDLREVPLFYTLFNSSSLQHRNERMWILQLLVEGLRDAQDYYVYKKRHVMELAMSYHDSQMSDQQSRKLVIRLVNAALSIHSAAFDLAKNYAIVGWIHSLCLASPSDAERLSTSLTLLHTLWFTIQQGKPGACHEMDSGDTPNSTPYPPNLCGESLLVCKTLVKLYSSSPISSDLPMLLELLESVLGHLRQSSSQGSHLTHQEVLQLIRLWCIFYNESQMLSALINEVQLTGDEPERKTSGKDERETFEKQESFNVLVRIISSWRPTLTSKVASEIDRMLILACDFGLHFATSSAQAADQSLLKVVTWFRHCVASSTYLQKSLLSHVGEPCLKRLLFLLSCASASKVYLVQELSVIFLVLLSRVEHVQSDMLGRTASEVSKLLSSDVYHEVMTSVEEILLPLCPSPLEDEIVYNVDVDVTTLLSAFLKDLWFIHPMPKHFFTLITTNKNTVSSKLSNAFKNGSTKLKRIMHSLKKRGTNM